MYSVHQSLVRVSSCNFSRSSFIACCRLLSRLLLLSIRSLLLRFLFSRSSFSKIPVGRLLNCPPCVQPTRSLPRATVAPCRAAGFACAGQSFLSLSSFLVFRSSLTAAGVPTILAAGCPARPAYTPRKVPACR